MKAMSWLVAAPILLAAGLAWAEPVSADRGDRINHRLDRKAARAAAHGHVLVAERLDRRGDRIDARLDRVAARREARLDRRH
jgi:hypothetical protein